MAESPESVLQRLAEIAVELCNADSAGISVLEVDEGREVFRWKAITGPFAVNLGGSMARDLSPCGVVVERDSVLLVAQPERHYAYPVAVDPPIVESLLVPFHHHGKAVGTLWVIAHTDSRKFDSEDARVMQTLSTFAGSAYQVLHSSQAAHRETVEREQTEHLLRESEVRYRTLFDSIDEGFCIVEVLFDESSKPIDYRFLDFNPAFAKQTGLVNARGKRMRELAPKHEEFWFETYGRIALTGEPVRFQSRAEQLQRWYDVFAFRFGQPEQRQVAILFNDITRQVQSADELRESENRLRTVIENLTEGLVVVDPDGVTLDWNRAALQMHGYGQRGEAPASLSSAAELYELRRLDGTRVPVEHWPVSRLLRGEELRDCEFIVHRHADKLELVLSYGGTLVRNQAGQVMIGLLTIRDVTGLKKAQLALVRSEKLASVGRMAATIAHEINNPLAAVMNSLFLVSNTPGLSEASRVNLDLADQELRRIAHITRQTLGFYREGGHPATVHLADVIDGTLDLYATRLKNKSATVEKRYRGEGKVFAIEGEVRQIVSNLVANSIDALANAGKLRIRITPINDRCPMTRLTIADTGIGILPENLKQLFEPFFTTKQSFGTGLGLWITSELVKKHAGSIRVRSRVGRGTVFCIWLPTERRRQQRNEVRHGY